MPVKRPRMVKPEEEGGYVISLPKGDTPKTQKIMEQKQQLQQQQKDTQQELQTLRQQLLQTQKQQLRGGHIQWPLHTIHHTIFVDLTEPDGRKGQNSGFSRSSKYQLWTIRMDYLQFCPLSRSPRCIILHEGSRTTPHWRQFPTEYK